MQNSKSIYIDVSVIGLLLENDSAVGVIFRDWTQHTLTAGARYFQTVLFEANVKNS